MSPNLKSPGYVIAFAAITSAVFTGGIIAVHQASQARVRRAEALSLDRALVELFDLVDMSGAMKDSDLAARLGMPTERELSDEEISRVVEQLVSRPFRINEGTDDELEIRVCYKTPADAAAGSYRDHDAVRAYAFPISGVGFWARIDGLLAVSPNVDRIVGIVFLRHSETPGLGGRITTDRPWRETFRPDWVNAENGPDKGLVITPAGPGKPFVYIDHEPPSGPGDPKHRRFVKALTGATGTSAAVSTFLNDDIARFRKAAVKAAMIPDEGGGQ